MHTFLFDAYLNAPHKTILCDFREEFKVRVKFKILSMKYFMGLEKKIFAYSYNGYTFFEILL